MSNAAIGLIRKGSRRVSGNDRWKRRSHKESIISTDSAELGKPVVSNVEDLDKWNKGWAGVKTYK